MPSNPLIWFKQQGLYTSHACLFPPMRLLTRTLHPSAAAPRPPCHEPTVAPPVKHFALLDVGGGRGYLRCLCRTLCLKLLSLCVSSWYQCRSWVSRWWSALSASSWNSSLSDCSRRSATDAWSLRQTRSWHCGAEQALQLTHTVSQSCIKCQTHIEIFAYGTGSLFLHITSSKCHCSALKWEVFEVHRKGIFQRAKSI